MRGLGGGLDIRLAHRVSRVEHGSKGVKVVTNRGEFDDGAPILMAFTGGNFARSTEILSDEDVADGAMGVLRKMFGSSIPEPQDGVRARWGRDPFAFGSYSHIPVGATPRDYDTLAEPVGDRLYFAGEATNRRYPATVHGAFLSGVREANRIAER